MPRASEDLEQAALDALSAGRVVAAATETFFGFLADASRADAVERIFALKEGRDVAKGIALLLPTRAAWDRLVLAIAPPLARLADAFWPGPLTIAWPARPGAPVDPRLFMDETVAVRLPAASPAARIAQAFGAPLTATSANLPRAPAATDDRQVRDAFSTAIEQNDLLVVPGRAPGGKASTLVTLRGGSLCVLRAGAIDEQALLAVLD